MKNLLILLFLFPTYFFSQKLIQPIDANGYKTSMRGLYSVNRDVIWASGTGGVIMKTSNGENWKSIKKVEFEKLDFRDIHAFNKKEAIIMSSGDGCEMYRTKNGGKKWEKVYENKEKGIFFDGMDFWDNKNGIAFSDPINNQFFLIRTEDGGNTWEKIESVNLPKTLTGEAGFAASGTGIVCKGNSTVFIGTGGGERARVYKSTDRGNTWEVYDTPLRGGEGNGIYSMSFIDEKRGIVIGGNYLDSTYIDSICAITSDGGETWKLISEKPPQGYRSCIAYNGKGIFLSCGRTGVDISTDGKSWRHLTDDAYYSCVVNGDTGWLTGRGGKMAKIHIKRELLLQYIQLKTND
jgi:photosystem II stability/assembly factor-like uncharacterized protein